MQPTLLVLAAGMGSRYGGLKQLDPVGPSGETLLDYAVFDAIRSGFGRVVFVIRKDFEEAFRTQVAARYVQRIPVDLVFQSVDALPPGFLPPPGREKPWGTGHAVWCARESLPGPFAVIGADDFFGRDAFAKLAEFLLRDASKAGPRESYCMVGYQLERTLSENGAVSRGVCEVGGGGQLQRVVEHTGIRREEVGPGRQFSGLETVSMNCWGFSPGLFPLIERQLREFLRSRGGELKSEFYLPEAVSDQIAAGEAQVEVLPTTASWFGVTFREDKPRVQAALAAQVQAGAYPERLF